LIKIIKVLSLLFSLTVFVSCGGSTKQIYLKDANFQQKDMYIKSYEQTIARADLEKKTDKQETISFPGGTIFGGASSSQMKALAGIVEESHNTVMKRLSELEKKNEDNKKELKEQIGLVNLSMKEIEKKTNDTMTKSFDMLKEIKNEIQEIKMNNRQIETKINSIVEEMNKKKTSFESKNIKIYFAQGSSVINDIEKNKIRNVFDNIRTGSKIVVHLHGSASPEGTDGLNRRLSMERAVKVRDEIRKYVKDNIEFKVSSSIARNISPEEYKEYRSCTISVEGLPISEKKPVGASTPTPNKNLTNQKGVDYGTLTKEAKEQIKKELEELKKKGVEIDEELFREVNK